MNIMRGVPEKAVDATECPSPSVLGRFFFLVCYWSMQKEFLVVGGVIVGSLVLIGGLAFLGARPRKPIEDVKNACVQHQGIGMHIHPHLRIVIDGEERPIPANIGVVHARCMRPLHTHDTSGTLHLEFPVEQEVRLGQFFEIWEQPFSRAQVLDRVVDASSELVVTVNGAQSGAVGELVLHDGDQIVVEVRKKEAAAEAPGGRR